MYAGIVVDQYGKVPEHVKQASNLIIYDVDKGRIERKVPLDGIGKARLPGWYVAREASNNDVDRLYSGRQLRILGIPILPRLLGFRRMDSEARPGSNLNDIVRELHENYQPQPQKLAPAYAH